MKIDYKVLAAIPLVIFALLGLYSILQEYQPEDAPSPYTYYDSNDGLDDDDPGPLWPVYDCALSKSEASETCAKYCAQEKYQNHGHCLGRKRFTHLRMSESEEELVEALSDGGLSLTYYNCGQSGNQTCELDVDGELFDRALWGTNSDNVPFLLLYSSDNDDYGVFFELGNVSRQASTDEFIYMNCRYNPCIYQIGNWSTDWLNVRWDRYKISTDDEVLVRQLSQAFFD